MEFDLDHDGLVYPNLDNARIRTCNPTPYSASAQPPPPAASVLDRMEALLVAADRERPLLERYDFDVEREVLARREARLERDASDLSGKDKHSVYSNVLDKIRECGIDNVDCTNSSADTNAVTQRARLAAKARAASSLETKDDIRMWRGIAKVKYNNAMKSLSFDSDEAIRKVRSDVGIEEESDGSMDMDEKKTGEFEMPMETEQETNTMALPQLPPPITADRAEPDAADWAIARSLDHLRAKEAQSHPKQSRSALSARGHSNFLSILDQLSPGRPINNVVISTGENALTEAVEAGNWAEVQTTAALLAGLSEFSPEEEKCYHEDHTNIKDTTKQPKADRKTDTRRPIEEVREEVKAIILRAAPDEIDNLSDMLLQFESREEQLIDTLRTMEGRIIAQRARAAAERTAQLEAKVQAHASPRSVHHFVRSGSLGSSHLKKKASLLESRKETLTALIEKGDWSGVAAAAGKYQNFDARYSQPQESDRTRHSLGRLKTWKSWMNRDD